MAMISHFALLPPIALLVLIAMINQCSPLSCKIGHANHKRGEQSANGKCDDKVPNAQHCFSVICIEQNFASTALLTWGCSEEADKKGCEEFFVNASNTALHSTKQHCECQFGDQGKDMANEHVKLPEAEKPGQIPSLPAVALNQRPASSEAGNGYGKTEVKECVGGEYCYAVGCQIATENFTFWGCALDNDCETLNKYLAFGHKCQCRIARNGRDMDNVDLLNPSFMPLSKMSHIDIVISELPIPTGFGTRANANIFNACATFAFGA
ncbi:hypothetical protein niasHS_008471 [Heterodera schachtii]|uniref:Uncharacterized protein n=1 Tax=Heterodera schachtii TaxID=97005 RepID=A0ABD2IWY9_HETSC